MPKIFPNQLQNWVLRDERRSAEIKVFNKCIQELPDDWYVFYSRPWWGLNERGGEKDGEADFILAHQDFGILFLEVKGGLISYDSQLDQWSSTDRYGIKHNFSKSPIQQAVQCKHQLIRKFKNAKNWPAGRVIAHHGVIFVDSVEPETALIGGFEKELFCNSVQFEREFYNWVQKRLLTNREKNEIGPGPAGMKVMTDVLAKPLQMRTTLSRASTDNLDSMNQQLTGIQLQALAEIEISPRIVIEGGAGTGKTVIACELALRSSENDTNVALCCVGDSLLSDFKFRLGSTNSNLHILSINELLLSENRFDRIIIDESQDLNWSDWDKVTTKLIDSKSKLVCFMDSNQAIYRLAADLESRLGARRITLRVNLRNTRKIAEVINNLYEGPTPQSFGLDGIAPIFTKVTTHDEATEKICAEILKLNKIEGVDFSSIVILSENKDFLRRLERSLNSVGVFHNTAKFRGLNILTLDTVLNFKGLESPFVIVYSDSDASNSKALSYVSTSRARTYLHVYGNDSNTIISRAIEQ